MNDQLPMFTPASQWKRPTELPDLRGRPLVAIDTEEKDNGLSMSRGPGWALNNGYVLGVSWATEDSQGYAPIAHPEGDNFDKEQVACWLGDLVKSRTPLAFQNAPYDVGWMYADLGVDIPMEYPIEDTLCMSFMLDENHYEYNLDAICARLGMDGKDEELMKEAGSAYLRPPNAKKSWKLTRKELKANMWKLPARYVGVYAEIDARRTFDAVQIMRPMHARDRVEAAYRLEMDLVPLVRRMRSRGVVIDTDLCLRRQRELRKVRDDILVELKRRLPGRGDVTMESLRSNKWLDPIFHDEGIQVPRTEGTRAHPMGQNSYKQEWMTRSEHWLPKLVSRATTLDRFTETFLGEYVMSFCNHKNGVDRLHAEIHQYKSDDGGTVSYRFAYSNPPLQQAPSPDRDPLLGRAFREVFIAEGVWGANDYSQQEYRLTAHFAAKTNVKGGRDAAELYATNPKLDFHQMVGDLSKLGRPRAKILNFALLYGQGITSTAEQLHCSEQDAKDLRDQVAKNAPFGPALDERARSLAQKRGYLRLLDGARVHFNLWESGFISREEFGRGLRDGHNMNPCTYEEAMVRRQNADHPWFNCNLRRANTRKALNRLIQGSAARQTKLAMRECGRANLIPVLQMHDELDHDEDSPTKIEQVAEIMRSVCKLLVPMRVDTGTGKSWAAAKSKDEKPAPPKPDVIVHKPPVDGATRGTKIMIEKPNT